ncbi:MAG: hypothetical protein GY820_28695 [Gammaproteobacteria bacterium]|nr:hypothetical protein [Gammaproteobacteria bacterium]
MKKNRRRSGIPLHLSRAVFVFFGRFVETRVETDQRRLLVDRFFGNAITPLKIIILLLFPSSKFSSVGKWPTTYSTLALFPNGRPCLGRALIGQSIRIFYIDHCCVCIRPLTNQHSNGKLPTAKYAKLTRVGY